MRKTAIIIVNPYSGKGIALRKAREARRILEKAGLFAEIFPTGGPGHGRELAAKHAGSVDVLVSVGGDGTLNEVVNGVVNADSETPVAIVPTGTANVVARELGLPKDFGCQVMLAVESDVRRLDLGCAGDRCFTMCAGAGLDAAIVDAVSRRRTERGITMLNYLIPAVREAALYRYPAIAVIVDGVLVDESSTFTVVGNMKRYGGLFRLFKDATPDDGLLDVCCLHGRSIAELARYAWSAYRERLHELKGVTCYRGKQITLEAADRVLLQIDGDPGGELLATFEVLPLAVTFCVPS